MDIKKIKKQVENDEINKQELDVFFESGFFSELPPCFFGKNNKELFIKTISFFINSSDNNYSLLEKNEISKFLNFLKKKNKYIKQSIPKGTEPTIFYISKNNGNERKISIPNFLSFFVSIIFLLEYKEEIFEIINSNEENLKKVIEKGRISKVEYKGDSYNWYLDVIKEDVDDLTYIDSKKIKNNFNKNKLLKYKKMTGLLKVLKVDIKEFYNSVYTHIFGQPFFTNFLEEKISICKDRLNSFQKSLESIVQIQNENQTNKLLTGPYSSNIFSELLLAFISNELKKEGNISFLHYKDDFEFYGDNEIELKEIENKFKKVIGRINLNINEEKTKVLNSYDDFDTQTIFFNLILDKIKVSSLNLNLAFDLISALNSLENQKIKYCIIKFKNFIKELNENGQEIDQEVIECLFSYFVNLLFLKSNLARVLYDIIYLLINNNSDNDIIEDYKIKIENLILKTKNYDNLSLIYLYSILIKLKTNPNNLIEIIKKIDMKINIFALSICTNYFNIKYKDISVENILELERLFKFYLEKQKHYKNIWYTKYFYFLIELKKLNFNNNQNICDELLMTSDSFIEFVSKEINFINIENL
ncbi:RNA-directed DNA polymerase [Spiroplasma endosymbiont of Cantharis rufa]|uniref:RNA-directed DNA polymerase n=1 Tax=Spiroplasma endosymbiont of Cantharis rufa TaxID=3066279 RepID=UPI0030CB1087